MLSVGCQAAPPPDYGVAGDLISTVTGDWELTSSTVYDFSQGTTGITTDAPGAIWNFTATILTINPGQDAHVTGCGWKHSPDSLLYSDVGWAVVTDGLSLCLQAWHGTDTDGEFSVKTFRR